MNEASDDSLPLLAGRFECVRELGHGGLATVYLARDRLLGRDCAIKLIHEHLAGDPAIAERFERELAINRMIRHRGVVEYYELFEKDGRAFLSLEYMAGGDLKSRVLRRGALPMTAAIDIADVILDALALAHGQGIIHGDIKPQNILFSAEGQPRLCDFGLARLASGERRALGSVDAGTPEYSPPELVQGRICDARGDLYAFGVTLFELSCGRLPFSANSALEILRAHVTDEPPSPRSLRPGLSPELEAVILQAMAKDPLDRFQSAAAFRESLLACRRELGSGQAIVAGSIASPTPTTAPTPFSASAKDSSHCPRCGRRISRLLPYCFDCGRDAPRLAAAAPKQTRSSVYILGPGAPASKFEAVDRKRLLTLLKAAGADASLLEKKLPRLPFVLAKDVTPLAAAQLSEAATELGLEAAHGQSPRRSSLPQAATLFSKKERTMTGRGLLVVLGSMTGVWSNLGRVFTHPDAGAAIMLGLAVLLIGGIVLTTRLGSRRAMARPALPDSGDSDWLRAQDILSPLRGALSAPSLRGLAAGVSLKLERLLDGDALRERYPEQADDFFVELDAFVSLCLAAQELERYLRDRPESAIVEDIRSIAAPSGDRPDAPTDSLRNALRDELSRRRELERSYNYFLDRILAFNTGLEALALAEAGAQGFLARRDGDELGRRLARARELLTAAPIGETA